MTSISSLPSTTPSLSPRAQVDARIAASASAGDISATDQKALSTALDSIDSSLQTLKDGSAGRGGMKERIDSLIESQVDTGSLNDDQAAELKSFFAQSAPTSGDSAGAGSSKGSGSSRGAGGPPSTSQVSNSASSNSTDGSKSGASIEDQLKSLEAMLDNLRQGLSVTSSAYGAASSGSVAPTGLVYQSIA